VGQNCLVRSSKQLFCRQSVMQNTNSKIITIPTSALVIHA